jgi:predicted ATPase
MDLFYQNLTFVKRKQRIHYGQFMIDVHRRLFQLKSSSQASNQKHIGYDADYVWNKIATDLFNESYLICIDEFQVTDIADAVILTSLFKALFQKGWYTRIIDVLKKF